MMVVAAAVPTQAAPHGSCSSYRRHISSEIRFHSITRGPFSSVRVKAWTLSQTLPLVSVRVIFKHGGKEQWKLVSAPRTFDDTNSSETLKGKRKSLINNCKKCCCLVRFPDAVLGTGKMAQDQKFNLGLKGLSGFKRNRRLWLAIKDRFCDEREQ